MSSKARRGGLARGARRLVKHVAPPVPACCRPACPTAIGDENCSRHGSTQTVMVYFPDTRVNLYQLRQWYDPLLALDERHPVMSCCRTRAPRDGRTRGVGLPAIMIAHYGRLDDLLSRSEVKLALYVNHNPQNFAALRFTSLAHVYLTPRRQRQGRLGQQPEQGL